MFTLAKVTRTTKKVLFWFGIGSVSLIILVALIRFGISLKEKLFPPPPTPPSVTFGKLPAPIFPTPAQTPAETQPFTYTLDTISGTLPQFADRAKVYTTVQPQPNLLALQNAQMLIGQTEFAGNPSSLTENMYAWHATTPFEKQLQYNIFDQSFTITTPSLSFATNAAALLDQQTAMEGLNTFLDKLHITANDLNREKDLVTTYHLAEGSLIPTTKPLETNVMRIDLYQKDIDGLPVYYSHPPFSSMHVSLLALTDQQPTVIDAAFFHTTLTTTESTYPIKTAEQALEQLKGGKGYIFYQGTDHAITITNVFLAYYLSDTPQQYVLPIIVFQGKNNFFAYITAVSDSFIQ